MDNYKPDKDPEAVAGKQANINKPNSEPVDQDSDFVVIESNSGPQTLVGVVDKKEPDDDLGVQTTSTLMEQTANEPGVTHSSETKEEACLFDEPIGSSSPMLLQNLDSPQTPDQMTQPATESPTKELPRLSDKEIKSIRRRLYAESGPTTADLKQSQPTQVKIPQAAGNQMNRPNPRPFGNTPIVPPEKKTALKESESGSNQPLAKTATRPKDEAPLQRRIAHFYNNFIHLPSGTKIRENDEIILRNKLYIMKQKRFSPGLVLGIAAPIFAVLVVIAVSLFVGGDTGVGRVIGVVVDDLGVPYNGGAIVRFPELNKSFQTDILGFFTTDQLPSGSHQIEYVVAGTVVGTEYATVVDNDITRLILAPLQSEEQVALDLPSPVTVRADYSAPPEMAREEISAQPAKTAPARKKSQAPQPKEAKLVLAANIEGATLKIDGKVIGVGNTTYPRLTPGQHKYAVTRAGYDTSTGTITLKAGVRQTLEVQLTPISEQAKAKVFDAKDYFYSGQKFVSSGDLTSAVSDYTHAIDLNPGYAEAYARRGDANRKTGDKRAAFEDYLRAGEIYKIRRAFNQATTAFSNAISIYPKAIEPVLGRGHNYLARGENIAAITDFEIATDINKKSPAARFGLGVARFNHGQYKKAIKEFKKARSLDPGDPATHQYLMLAYLARNDTKNVKKSYDNFLKHATEDQIVAFHSNKRLTAVIRVIDMGN